MSMKMLAGAAAIAALIATPAMATQQKASGPQQQSADATGGKKAKKMQSRLESRASIDDQRRSGFWPLDVTAGVVGGAVNTAGAIVTAPLTPFRGDSYAYYRGTATGRGMIADDNGPKCRPGQLTTINGQRMRCQ